VDTGQVDILNYVMAHDSGNLINPMVVDGQVRGATAHGIGNALYERLIYDDDAQPQTTTFADYLLPTAMEIPDIGVVHIHAPTPTT
jgi:aerobic carbon-monoxide dehydrogenase large subunit